jgi:hypothetical protein
MVPALRDVQAMLYPVLAYFVWDFATLSLLKDIQRALSTAIAKT